MPLNARLMLVVIALVCMAAVTGSCGPAAVPVAPVGGPARDNTPAPQPAPASEPMRLRIVHYNDFHATFEPQKEDGKPVGGIATLVAAVKQARADAKAHNERLLVLDAGDFATGQVLHMITRGRATIEFQNLVNPDCAVPGNHEFDMGDTHFVKLIKGELDGGNQPSTFPWVCANIQTPGAPWTPWKVFDLQGLRVGVIGLNTPSLTSTVVRSAVESSRVEEAEPALERALGELQGKADMIVVLSHCGVDVDKSWLKKFAGRVHLVVAGHSHTTLKDGTTGSGVPIVSAGAYSRWLGQVDVTFDPAQHKVTGWKARLQSLRHDEAPAPPDQATATLLAGKLEAMKPELDRRIANAKAMMSRIARPESALGVWQARAMMNALPGADLGLMNPYGVRRDLPKGPITVGDMLECNPFRNTLVRIRLTGAEILRATSINLTDRVLPDGKPDHARPLQWANARIEYNPMLPEDRRVVKMTVGGKTIDPAREYIVVTNNYVGGQAKKYFHVERDVPVDDSGLVDADVLIAAAEAEGELAPLDDADSVYHLVPAPPGSEIDPSGNGFVLGEFNVVAVFDGDTIRVGGLNQSIRFLGIDTEETFKNGHGRSEEELRAWATRDFADYCKAMRDGSARPVKFATPMGEAAKEFVAKRLEHARVRLEFDDPARMKDVYDRWLCYIFYQPAGASDDAPWINIAEETVREGLAPYYVKYGHLARFHKEFAAAEAAARAAKKGIWSPQPSPGVPDHYPDYDERWPWWQRVGNALEAYKAARKADPAKVPLMIEDGADADKLPALVGQTVSAFVRTREGGVSGLRVTCGFNADQFFSISFASDEQMKELWKSDYEGELLLVRGKLVKAGSKGWSILPQGPGDVAPYQ
ncbi:MAG: 5'-nucleotidase C-terminal domain-containing protein [Planctomycetota bacterium]